MESQFKSVKERKKLKLYIKIWHKKGWKWKPISNIF
jgi:hypothetical protein